MKSTLASSWHIYSLLCVDCIQQCLCGRRRPLGFSLGLIDKEKGRRRRDSPFTDVYIFDTIFYSSNAQAIGTQPRAIRVRPRVIRARPSAIAKKVAVCSLLWKKSTLFWRNLELSFSKVIHRPLFFTFLSPTPLRLGSFISHTPG